MIHHNHLAAGQPDGASHMIKGPQGPRIFPRINPKGKLAPLAYPGATKVEGKTSKVCPVCGCKNRRRSYPLTVPLQEKDLDDFPLRPEDVNRPKRPGLPWFGCETRAICPCCGSGSGIAGEVAELRYRRQFGRLRLIALWFKGQISTKNLVRSLQSKYWLPAKP